MKKYTSRALEDTRKIAKEVLADLDNNIILLQGELGSGKTAFAKLLAEELGITEVVTSPTFILLKAYPIADNPKFKRLVHVDLYRLESADAKQVVDLGLQEYLDDEQSLVLIEWPERIEEKIKNSITLQFKILDNIDREVIII